MSSSDERAFWRDENRFQAELARAEAAQEWADTEFGEGWEDKGREPEFQNLISEDDMADRHTEELETLHAFQQHFG